MANGAAVAAMSKAAMIRNQWTGKVARRAVMAFDCVLILISVKRFFSKAWTLSLSL
jgi:hypothetical protein